MCVCTGIVKPPSDVTVFTNQTGNFTCVTANGTAYWIVNGTSYADLPDEIRGDLKTTTENTHMKHVLSIPGRVEYNGTKVMCVATDGYGTSSNKSENATLIIIQGMLYNTLAYMYTHIPAYPTCMFSA